jgi:cell division septation protein DedD
MRITIHNYVVTPDDPSAGANVSTYTTGNMPPLTEVSSPAPQLPVITTGAPQPSAWGPAAEVVVIPGLPDPLSGKVYRLQVGSYSSSESAAGIMKILETAGFVPVNEPHANLVRVLVTGIQAASVQSAIQRLGSIGFTQIWVRE